jgi:hypothetical protein
MDDGWIVIPNWDEYQHYKDRDAPWIKDYVAQLHHPDYRGLTFAQRGLLHDLRLLYAASNRNVPHARVHQGTHAGMHAYQNLSGALGARVDSTQLLRLNEAGLIAFAASRPLAARTKRREEKRREEHDPLLNASDPEPERDPDAAQKMRDLADRIGRGL